MFNNYRTKFAFLASRKRILWLRSFSISDKRSPKRVFKLPDFSSNEIISSFYGTVLQVQKPHTEDDFWNYSFSTFEWNNVHYHLLGTVHNSKRSIEHINKAISEIEPDVLVLEVDPRFFHNYGIDEALDRNDILPQSPHLPHRNEFSISKQYYQRRNYFLACIYPMFESESRFIRNSEIGTAIQLANQHRIQVVCGDIPSEILFMRAYKDLSWKAKASIVTSFLWHIAKSVRFGKKESDIVQTSDNNNDKEEEEFWYKHSLIMDKSERGLGLEDTPTDQLHIMLERDLYFTHILRDKCSQFQNKKVLWIGGLAHVHGIMRMWQETGFDSQQLLTTEQGFGEVAHLFQKHYSDLIVQKRKKKRMPL